MGAGGCVQGLLEGMLMLWDQWGDLDEGGWRFIGWVRGRERRHTAKSQVHPGTQRRP